MKYNATKNFKNSFFKIIFPNQFSYLAKKIFVVTYITQQNNYKLHLEVENNITILFGKYYLYRSFNSTYTVFWKMVI